MVEKYRDLAELYETRLEDVDGAFLYMSQAFRLEPGSEAIHDRLLGYAEIRGAWDANGHSSGMIQPGGYQKPHPPCRFIHLGHAEYTPAPTPT